MKQCLVLLLVAYLSGSHGLSSVAAPQEPMNPPLEAAKFVVNPHGHAPAPAHPHHGDDASEHVNPPSAPVAPASEHAPAPAPAEDHTAPSPAPEEGHAAPAPAEGHDAPAPAPEEGHPAPAPADEGHAAPVPAEGEHHAAPAPAEGEHHPAPAPAEGEHTEGEHHAAPAPAEGGHDAPAPAEGEHHPAPAPAEGGEHGAAHGGGEHGAAHGGGEHGAAHGGGEHGAAHGGEHGAAGEGEGHGAEKLTEGEGEGAEAEEGGEHGGKEHEDSEEMEEEEEEHVHAKPIVVATAVLCITSLLVVISVAFEKGREHLEYATSKALQPVLRSLFQELTLLGFIGLALFFTENMGFIEHVSKQVFKSPSHLLHMFHEVHYVLFCVMAFFLVEIVLVVLVAGVHEKGWKRMEIVARSETHLQPLLEDIAAGRDRRRCGRLSYYPSPDATLSYVAVRDEFVHPRHSTHKLGHKAAHGEHGHALPAEFPFDRYLAICQGEFLSEIIEVPISMWFALEGLFIIFWFIQAASNKVWIVYTFVALAYVTALAIVKLDRHLSWVIKQITPPKFSRKLGLVKEARKTNKTNKKQGHKEETKEKESLLDGGHDSHDIEHGVDDEPPYARREVPPRSWCGNKCYKRQPNKQEALFWFDVKGVHFIQFFVTFILLVMSIYATLLSVELVQDACDEAGYLCTDGRLWAEIIILAFPLPLILYFTPHIIQKTTFVAHVELLKDNHSAHEALRQVKLDRAIYALTLLTKLTVLSGEQSSGGLPRKTAKEIWTDDYQYEEERDKVRNMFDRYDTDKSGTIDANECAALLRSLGMLSTTPQPGEITEKDVLASMDENGDGEVSFDELLNWIARQQQASKLPAKEKIAQIFRAIDTDNSGQISLEEFEKMLRGVNPDMTASDIAWIVNECDKNSDNCISLEEFTLLMENAVEM